jgi:PLP dependent protein
MNNLLQQNYFSVREELKTNHTELIAVSKTKPVEAIQALYNLGQRTFGENYVQELVEKQVQLPSDIQWHYIGHLQSNKVKYIAPFVHTIHAVDSLKLLIEIEKQAAKFQRKINCLLQIHVADETTKFGIGENELENIVAEICQQNFESASISGVMGMATNTDDEQQINFEFAQIKKHFDNLKDKFFSNNPSFSQISMGMSSDYKLAVKNGSTMVRIGSLLFGER